MLLWRLWPASGSLGPGPWLRASAERPEGGAPQRCHLVLLSDESLVPAVPWRGLCRLARVARVAQGGRAGGGGPAGRSLTPRPMFFPVFSKEMDLGPLVCTPGRPVEQSPLCA